MEKLTIQDIVSKVDDQPLVLCTRLDEKMSDTTWRLCSVTAYDGKAQTVDLVSSYGLDKFKNVSLTVPAGRVCVFPTAINFAQYQNYFEKVKVGQYVDCCTFENGTFKWSPGTIVEWASDRICVQVGLIDPTKHYVKTSDIAIVPFGSMTLRPI